MSKSIKKLEARLAKLKAKEEKARKAFKQANKASDKAQNASHRCEDTLDVIQGEIEEVEDALKDLRLDSDLPETKTVTFSRYELVALLRYVPSGSGLFKKLAPKSK